MKRGLIALLLLGCGGATPRPEPPPAPSGHRVLVVRADADTAGGFEGVDEVRSVPPAPTERTDPGRHDVRVEAIRRLYRDLAFVDALTAANEATDEIGTDVRDASDAVALYRLAVYRGMCELALGHAEAARAAFRAAVAVRPEATLPAEEFPPDVREMFDRERDALRAEPAVELTPRVTPAGATVSLDGEVVGDAPASIATVPGAHYLRAAAPLHAPQTLALELGAGSAAPEIALARLVGEELVRALDPGGASRLDAVDRATVLDELGATSLLLVERAEDGWHGVSLEVDGSLRTAREPGLATLVASLVPPRRVEAAEPEPGESVWESPWLWGIAGGVVVAVGVAVLIGFAAQPTGHELVLSSSGR